jgi:enoyl-CoA hydratase
VTAPPVETRIHSLHEAIDRLGSPFAIEELATLGGEGVLIVDLPVVDSAKVEAAGLEIVRERMGQLACPSIAISQREISASASVLRPEFDIVLESGRGGLDAVLAPMREKPLATLALVQLLRHNEKSDVHQGLVAESIVYSILQTGLEFGGWAKGHTRRVRPAWPEPAVLTERRGARLTITLNRPDRHNAFAMELRDGLVEGLELALYDDSVEEVVLRGNGPSFCSGGDLDEFGSFPDAVTAHAVRSTRNAGRLLAALAPRARAEVHGACVGAGVELPAFVSHVEADEDAFFQLPELSMGLVPGAGGTVSLTKRIGRQRTTWLALSGERIDAATALEWGLVDAVVSGAG